VSTLRLPDIAPRSARASGDRWLFGYADVVTLLFACFAALYAAAVSPAASASAGPAAVAPRSAQPIVASALAAVDVSALQQQVESLRAREPQMQIEVTPSQSGTVISLAEAGSFAPGQAELTPAAIRVIGQLAAMFSDERRAVRVEGHTDDRPIQNTRFANNWELSTARATRVVQWLVEEGRLAPGRLSAAGYGEYRPRFPNDTPENRARNRRVDIVVLDENAQGGAIQADSTDVGLRSSGRR